MTAQILAEKRLAEAWRAKAGRIRLKYKNLTPPKDAVEIIAAAFETCAEELEELTKEK